jgi:Photosynthesis system II assembly factor YCF48/BNR/Asp-box repeat
VIPAFARMVWGVSLLAVCAASAVAQRWQVQYFYDQDRAHLQIVDLQFPSSTRGIAVGAIVDPKHSPQPTSVLTTDGGAHWQMVPLKEQPISLFFLNENVGWLVTAKGLWKTTEMGKNWTKLPKAPGEIYRVCFTDETHGWGVGPKKTVLETQDGGQNWKPLAMAAQQPGDAHFSSYTWIVFATPQLGLITGWNIPPRAISYRERPEWIDPQAALRRRDPPHLSYNLYTRDGGKTWQHNSTSLFGTVTRIRMGSKGDGLGLIEYGPGFRFPSEAYALDWTSGKSRSVYHDTKFAISDIWMTPDGTAYLAGNVPHGELGGIIPGKVRVLTSKDLAKWEPMDVDYRAEAIRTMLAAPDADNLWMATDTGMILKLKK